MDDVDEIQAEPKEQPEELAIQPIEEIALAEEEPLASTSAAAGLREIPLQGDQTSPAKVRLVTDVVELLKDLKSFVNLMEAMEFLKSDSESEEEEESAPEHSEEEGNPGVMDDVDEIQDQASFKMQEYFMTLTKKRMEKLRKMQKEKDSFRIHTKMQEYFMTLTTKRMEKLGKMQKEEDSFGIHTKMQEYFKTLTKKRMEKLRKMQKEEEQEWLADEDDMDVDDNEEYEQENSEEYIDLWVG